MYRFDFTPVLVICVLIGAGIILIIWGLVGFLRPTTIKVKKKLEPISYEIKIKNNKIDTTWIYKRP